MAQIGASLPRLGGVGRLGQGLDRASRKRRRGEPIAVRRDERADHLHDIDRGDGYLLDQIRQRRLAPRLELPFELFLEANNAPNVSDVVRLLQGEVIQIHAWWDAGFAAGALADLTIGRHKTYVSVHKIS